MEITSYFQISKDVGTGGGIFHKMYGEFLIESVPIINDERLVVISQKFIDVSEHWNEIANDMWELSQTANVELLKKMSNSISEIYEDEKDLYLSLKTTVK